VEDDAFRPAASLAETETSRQFVTCGCVTPRRECVKGLHVILKDEMRFSTDGLWPSKRSGVRWNVHVPPARVRNVCKFIGFTET
jgi:hypothetical protein